MLQGNSTPTDTIRLPDVPYNCEQTSENTFTLPGFPREIPILFLKPKCLKKNMLDEWMDANFSDTASLIPMHVHESSFPQDARSKQYNMDVKSQTNRN